MDWTKHRKYKDAAKVHVALDLISFIPIRVVTDSANHHDGSYMSELCGNMKPGDIAVMDRAYVDYIQLNTFRTYKTLQNKKTEVGDFFGVDTACRIIDASFERFAAEKTQQP